MSAATINTTGVIQSCAFHVSLIHKQVLAPFNKRQNYKASYAYYFHSEEQAQSFADAYGGKVDQTSPPFYDRKNGHNAGIFRVTNIAAHNSDPQQVAV